MTLLTVDIVVVLTIKNFLAKTAYPMAAGVAILPKTEFIMIAAGPLYFFEGNRLTKKIKFSSITQSSNEITEL